LPKFMRHLSARKPLAREDRRNLFQIVDTSNSTKSQANQRLPDITGKIYRTPLFSVL
jgi:hypothetical protein